MAAAGDEGDPDQIPHQRWRRTATNLKLDPAIGLTDVQVASNSNNKAQMLRSSFSV
jgi:hypothetical protein